MSSEIEYSGQVLKLFANVPEGKCSDFAFGVVCFESPGQLALVFMFGSCFDTRVLYNYTT